jgi:hypothetical protein
VDPGETSAALLLFIAKSQQRIELGIPNTSSAPVEIAPFVVSSSARWVNGLWFVALALSLSAALLAMTTKEWLDAFITSHKRAPHDFALHRQARFDAFQWWRTPHIMDVLPTLLHLSLVLFSLGLVVYLWLLDRTISIVLAVIIGATALLYVGTILLATFYDDCPFVTRISRYLRFAIDAYTNRVRSSHKNEPGSSDRTTSSDLHALWWLLENARDQLNSDCVLRSLVGLHNRKFEDAAFSSAVDKSRQQTQSNDYIIAQTYTNLCRVLESTLRRSPMENRILKGVDLGRYAAALSELLALTFRRAPEDLQDSQGKAKTNEHQPTYLFKLVRENFGLISYMI